VQDHPEEEVEKDEDEQDRWWEEGKEGKEVVQKTATKDAGNDPWEWRDPTKKEQDEEAPPPPPHAVNDFENDGTLDKRFINNPKEEEEDRDICNFDLDLYSGDF
jgi:hypothetical protein